MAWRTSSLSKGALALLVDRIVSPSVEPRTTVKRGSASIWGSVSGLGQLGKASTSPAISAASAAVGSEMNLNVAESSATGSPQ